MTRLALDFAHLLNEARKLLRGMAHAQDFEQRCLERVGPIVEQPAANRDEPATTFPSAGTGT